LKFVQQKNRNRRPITAMDRGEVRLDGIDLRAQCCKICGSLLDLGSSATTIRSNPSSAQHFASS
jgi:hypothetical protein